LNNFNVAVVGATGAVGREMLKILEERDFPVNELKLIATEKSAGITLGYKGNEIEVEVVRKGIFKGIDIALFSAGSEASKQIAPMAVKEGTVVIDNSNAFRMDNEVPLVVPEINSEEIFKNKGIIANPNCSTIQMVTALKPIYDAVGIKRIVISTYQAVSGTGKKAIDELREQLRSFLEGEEIKSEVYPYQIALNIIPHIDVFLENDYTREEMKLIRETRKILNDYDMAITSTAARVPVFYGHSESVNIETVKKISIKRVKELLYKAKGVKLIDKPEDLIYPMAIMSEKEDDVLVGRLREDHSIDKGINMWIVANNLRKGAALNAVQIAEHLIAEGK
jgi:aspartate-semialdehyde dehydrogenase